MKKNNRLYSIGIAVFLCFCASLCLVGCGNNDDKKSERPCNHNVGYDGICTICEEYVSTEGVLYQISADGKTAEVCGYEGTDSSVVLAKEYNSLPVTTIATWAFRDCDNLSHVVLSDTITAVNSWAFSYCTDMTSIVLGKNLTTIEDFAFSQCFRLVEIYNKSKLSITVNSTENGNVGYYAKNIYSNPTNSKLTTDKNGYVIYSDGAERELIAYIGTETNFVLPESITKINDYAFYNMDMLTSIVIGNNVKEIGQHAFGGCDSLENITVGDGVLSLKNEAFAYCINLNEIKLGKQLADIGEWAFKNCNKLTNIIVEESNSSYMSINGNLYTKDGKKLLQYATGKAETTVTIPSHVTDICRGAFQGCETITDIIVGDNVSCVEDWAFAECKNLTSVSFGKSVNYISDSAFENTKLLNITVDKNNTRYMAENGVLYSFANGIKCLELYAAQNTAETFTVPDDVYYINRYAFADCDYLKNVIIGKNVNRIFPYAFDTCKNLTSVKIANGNTIIDENAFFQCDKLTDVTLL